jgi:parallel beta-helix repeat protein
MIITENQIGGNAGYGAYLNNGFITFDSNQVYSNTLGGIYDASSDDTISNNEIDSNPGGGIFLTGYAGEAVGNTLYQNGGSQIMVTGTDTTITSNDINYGLGQGLTIDASSCIVENNVLTGNGNLSIIQAFLNGANCTVSGNVFDGGGVSKGGLEINGVTSQTGNMVTGNIFENNVGADFSFDNDAIYLDRCNAPTTIRDNSGLNLLSATPKLFWINGAGYIQAYGKDFINGVGNATSSWASGQKYTVTGFDVNVYLVGGGPSDTVVVNGINIVSAAQITTLPIPAPVGTTITITCTAMPTIIVIPVPQ